MIINLMLGFFLALVLMEWKTLTLKYNKSIFELTRDWWTKSIKRKHELEMERIEKQKELKNDKVKFNSVFLGLTNSTSEFGRITLIEKINNKVKGAKAEPHDHDSPDTVGIRVLCDGYEVTERMRNILKKAKDENIDKICKKLREGEL